MPLHFNATCKGCLLTMACGCHGAPHAFANAVNKRSGSAFSSSTGVKVTVDAVVAAIAALIVELNCNKCQSDKQQFFTVKSTANKGRNATKTMLKTKFPTLMFHQKNRFDLHKFETYEHCTTNGNTSMSCQIFQQDRHLHWQGCLHGCACLVIAACSCCHTSVQ